MNYIVENTYPKISVLLGVYNGEEYLHEAIDSILKQSFKNFEFIIINDGSNDNSVEIIKSYNDSRIVLISQQNKGLPAALNQGLKIAKGKYIARMDADDISEPNRFLEQLLYMEKNPHCVVVASLYNMMTKEGEHLYVAENIIDNKELKGALPYEAPFAHGSSLIRKKALKLINGYHIKMRFGQDMLLWIDLAELGDFSIIPKPLYNFRITPFSNSIVSKKYRKLEHEIFAEYYEFKTLNFDKLKMIPSSGGGLTFKQKMSNYYLRIGMIYLIKNLDVCLARANFHMSIKHNVFNINPYIYYILSYFPINFVLSIKKTISNLRGLLTAY
ncbi:glycosyltransferase [Bacteroidota bacterium]